VVTGASPLRDFRLLSAGVTDGQVAEFGPDPVEADLETTTSGVGNATGSWVPG